MLPLLALLPSMVLAQERLEGVTFTAPVGWEREAKPSVIAFNTVDRATRSWCQLSVYRPVATRGSLVKDFDADWKAFVASTMSARPKLTDGPDVSGWKGRTGVASGRFNAERMVAMLVTLAGNGQAVSVVAKGNAETCLEQAKTVVASMTFHTP
jgi:hypothetical protein